MPSRCYPGDGGYPRSIIAGLVAGEDGGFLSLTNAALVSGKRRLSFEVVKVEVFRGSAMDPLVAAVEISRRRSPATVTSGDEEDSGGSRFACLGFPVMH
ncbi:unnamed protein product [Brassica napus]|uniref:(rape) hypothetical protein n=1 Tax=Brassica napus TaxID=3708 RepID=A0A817AC84_BRANA|nr:unnamed protein product [Brassica napus]